MITMRGQALAGVEESAPRFAARRPFASGDDPRRGRGPAKGAPNAGRPADWLKEQMAAGREMAVQRLVDEMDKLQPDHLLRIVEKWAPCWHAITTLTRPRCSR